MDSMMLRSMLFAPASHARRVEKAFQVDADAVIVDLEDAVAHAEKASARQTLGARIPRSRTTLAYVRVNGFQSEHFLADLCAAASAGVDGVILPKVEARDQLVIADWILAQEERRLGLSHCSIDLVPHFESAVGLSRAAEILGASSRLRRAGFGGGDFAADMNLHPSRDEGELMPFRAALVLASRYVGIESPIDSVWSELKDLEGLRRSAEAARRAGFQGKRCIHPDQVPIVNEVFTPSEQEIARAERIVAAFDAAEARGTAAIRVANEFVDYPVAARARRVLSFRDHLKSNAQSGAGANPK
jgi:citrate lyase subunit beta/citryl-CoA lyase